MEIVVAAHGQLDVQSDLSEFGVFQADVLARVLKRFGLAGSDIEIVTSLTKGAVQYGTALARNLRVTSGGLHSKFLGAENGGIEPGYENDSLELFGVLAYGRLGIVAVTQQDLLVPFAVALGVNNVRGIVRANERPGAAYKVNTETGELGILIADAG